MRMPSIKVSPLMSIDRTQISPFHHKLIIGWEFFYFFNKGFFFTEPSFTMFFKIISKSILFQIVLKWPFIPNMTLSINKILNICISSDKPYKLHYNDSKKCFFRSNQRKSVSKIVFSLHPKYAGNTSPSSIIFMYSVFFYFFE